MKGIVVIGAVAVIFIGVALLTNWVFAPPRKGEPPVTP